MKNTLILEKTFLEFSYLAQVLFTTTETELDYYHQKVNVPVTSRVAKRLKTNDLIKLIDFKKVPKMLGSDGEYPAGHPKTTFWRSSVKNAKNYLQNIP